MPGCMDKPLRPVCGVYLAVSRPHPARTDLNGRPAAVNSNGAVTLHDFFVKVKTNDPLTHCPLFLI